MLTFVGMKRIFHIISHFDMGGAERVALNIAKSKSDGFEYHIVEVIRGRSAFTRQFISEMEQAHIHYHRSPIPVVPFHYLFEKMAARLFPLWFYFLFKRYRPTIIHCHSEIPEWATYQLCHLFPHLTAQCQVVRTIHNTSLWNGLKHTGSKVEKWLQAKDANIAISTSVVENYEHEYHATPPIIYNGIAPCTHKQVYPDLRTGKTNVIFAGRMEEQKGIKHLICIIQGMEDDERYHFHLFGEGRLKETLIRQLNGLSNVSIHPPHFGLASYLGSFDYLLMPSEHEGLALLSIEASMEGTPTIINAAKGLEDTLPVDWPLKVHDNQTDAYLHLFKEVIPRGKRDEWGQTARHFALSNFSLEKMQQAYERIYRQKTSKER